MTNTLKTASATTEALQMVDTVSKVFDVTITESKPTSLNDLVNMLSTLKPETLINDVSGCGFDYTDPNQPVSVITITDTKKTTVSELIQKLDEINCVSWDNFPVRVVLEKDSDQKTNCSW
ncbi:hypothetical protein [Flavobacterium sp.]|jgi:hypothetical protein|uniref:hypothetical protein n=1 Tax=Flavobacterium sp. TaxID=239 RepID=UPI0037C19765